MKVSIDNPAKFYEEVRELISVHYKPALDTIQFAKKYPTIYHLYLQIAALGLRKEEK